MPSRPASCAGALQSGNGDPLPKRTSLTVANAFYLATKGGGSFFGKVGSFEPDYEFDAGPGRCSSG